MIESDSCGTFDDRDYKFLFEDNHLSYFDTRPLCLYHLRFRWFRVYGMGWDSCQVLVRLLPFNPAFPLQSYKVKTCQLVSPVALRESSGTKCWTTVNLKNHEAHAI